MEENIDIVLLGDKNDKKIAEKILNQLTDVCRTVYSSGAVVRVSQKGQSGQSNSARLYECDEIIGNDLSKIVVIAKKTADLKYILNCQSKPLAVIVSSENERQLKELQNAELTVITCGLSQKDTVTFSSNDDSSCIISLQREFKLGSSTIEPQEAAAPSECKSSFSVLAASAAVIIVKHILSQSSEPV